MLFTIIIGLVSGFLDAMFFWLPLVDTLPLGMDSALTMAFGYFRSFMAIFPPVQVLYDATFWFVFYFLLPLMVLRLLRIIR